MSANALAVQQDSVVASLQRASTALVEAKTIQQTKKIIDVAAAAEIYAKRQQLGEENISIAHSIKLEALRKLGEMLRDAPKAKGSAGPGRGKAGSKSGPAFNDAPTLAELGLDKKTSAVAQKLAELPQESFEQVRDGHETIAKAIAAVAAAKDAVIEAATPSAQKPDLNGEQTEFVQAYEAEEQQQSITTPELNAEESDALREQLAELSQNLTDTIADNESMARVWESDDKIIASLAEAKRYREQVRILETRINGLMNEKNEAVRAANSWKRKFEKLEKAQQARTPEDVF